MRPKYQWSTGCVLRALSFTGTVFAPSPLLPSSKSAAKRRADSGTFLVFSLGIRDPHDFGIGNCEARRQALLDQILLLCRQFVHQLFEVNSLLAQAAGA